MAMNHKSSTVATVPFFVAVVYKPLQDFSAWFITILSKTFPFTLRADFIHVRSLPKLCSFTPLTWNGLTLHPTSATHSHINTLILTVNK